MQYTNKIMVTMVIMVLMVITACGTAEQMAAISNKTVPGTPVYYVPSQGVYAIDLNINGHTVHNVVLDTGSANLIVAKNEFVEKNAAVNSFTIQFASFSGAVTTYDSTVELQGQTIDYPVGVFTSGGLGSILGLGYKTQSVSATIPLGDTLTNNGTYTLNMCRPNESGSFIEFGKQSDDIPQLTTVPLTATNYISVQPNSISGVHYPRGVTLLDSGTNNFLYLPTSVLSGLANLYPDLPRNAWNYGHAYLTDEQAATLRPLMVAFDGITIEIPVEVYTVKTQLGTAILTVPAIRMGNQDVAILSTIFMQNAVFVINKEARTVAMASNKSICNQ